MAANAKSAKSSTQIERMTEMDDGKSVVKAIEDLNLEMKDSIAKICDRLDTLTALLTSIDDKVSKSWAR